MYHHYYIIMYCILIMSMLLLYICIFILVIIIISAARINFTHFKLVQGVSLSFVFASIFAFRLLVLV